MRVLHFLPVYPPAWQFGGPILSVSRLCEGLVRQGIEVRVITTNFGLPEFPTNQLGVTQNVNGVQVIYYSADHQVGPVRSQSLLSDLDDHMQWAELLHLSSIWQPLGISVQRAAHTYGVPIIQTLRGALGPYSWTRGFCKKLIYFLFVERRLLQSVARIHCTTPQEIREARWLCLKPPIELLPNPLDLSSLTSDQEIGRQWRTKHDISLTTTLFIVAGRLHHKKGLDLLPKALKKLDHHDWNLCIVGDDDDGSGVELRCTFENLGMASRIRWFPSIPSSDLFSPLNAADWLLLPSRHENFGNIAVEALSCGCGVVLSDRVGVSDMLDGCPGVLIGPRKIRIWTDLLTEAMMLERPSASSANWVNYRFNSDLIAHQATEIYRNIFLYG